MNKHVYVGLEFPAGKLIKLVAPHPKHYPRIREILSDEISLQYLRHMLKPGGWTLEQVEGRYKDLAKKQALGENFAHIMVEVKTGEVVGYTGFYVNDGKKGETGVALDKAFWKRGYGCDGHLALLNYAFDVMGYEAIEFVTENTNIRTQKFYESLGLGRVKEQVRLLADGSVVESVYYEVSKEAWPAMKNALTVKVDSHVRP